MKLPKLIDQINFDKYSSSEGFVGYFERSGPYKDNMEDLAIMYFLKFIKENSYSGYRLISSIFVNEDEIGRSGDSIQDKKDNFLSCNVKKLGFVSSLSFKNVFGSDFQSIKYVESVERNWSDFKNIAIQSIEPALLLDLIKIKMTSFGIYGHLFFVNEITKLAFYAHDDQGFGVISLRRNAKASEAIEFLTGAERLVGFKSFISVK
ncbi:hypothetical protein [Brucella pituitosa]|uniref:hypothetical protein n=1 Tax=Brucella pituitosa TaxID=571256 RepID=UPI0009A17BB3|nr:hypothetical protein [Brucella pituitosa]